ncbi:acyltransferase domain-containing protein [Streptomyces sp. YGL11-2]|uniref:acyltransferase domain-containing protein n=1 Tax=Streptomyces sp. YGL11-2 TaxID=3414028 RepID=UPI003CF6B2F1
MTASEAGDGEEHIAVIGMAVRFGQAADLHAYREQLRTTEGVDTNRPLADPYAFDNRFFGISPRESVILDPQQRLLLECAHQALEDAAHDPAAEDAVIGIYAGGSTTTHAALLRRQAARLPDVDDRQIRAATGADFLAARAAYKLGLTGPAVSVQAAGATALVAVHTAAQALLGGECDIALAGAVTVRAAAPAEGATGGCAVVVLKPLPAAQRDGDRIYAVVRGTAVGSAGPSEPAADAQERIARNARAVGGMTAETIAGIEAAAGAGVTDTAPAMAAFITAVLSVEGGEPLGTAGGRPDAGPPRRAGVSASGPFGAHAHVIVEQPPAVPATEDEERWHLLPFSAKSPAALEETAARLGRHLERSAYGAALRDVAWTLQTGRTAHAHRACAVARTTSEAAAALAGMKLKNRTAKDAVREAPPVVFTFPGHGGQHMGMGRHFYRADRQFRADLDACARRAQAETGLDLRGVLNPVGEEAEEAARTSLSNGAIAQLAVFILEYAVARAFIRWGVRPAAVVGHSLGGYAAACVAGVFSFPDALTLVVKRTELLLGIEPGAMAAVRMPEAELLPLLPAGVDIGVISGPDQVTISGPREAVEQFVAESSAKGLEIRLLKIPGAGHSSLVEPVLGEFATFLESIEFHEPRIPVISDTTGTWARPEEISTPAYWCDHMRKTVRYNGVLDTLHDIPRSALVEIGPGTTLTSLARRHAGLRKEHIILQALPHPTDPTPDMKILLTTLGALWAAGVEVKPAALHTEQDPRKTGLPGHPFQRTEFPVPTD